MSPRSGCSIPSSPPMPTFEKLDSRGIAFITLRRGPDPPVAQPPRPRQPDLPTSVVTLITRYAQRMLIENGIAEAINFLHLDTVSLMVGLKADLDLQMALMATSLYRLMAQRIGRGYRRATAKRSSASCLICQVT
jgi:hypothetical protein